MTPPGPVLHSVFENPPPRSSETTSSLRSDVTSDWCEISMLCGFMMSLPSVKFEMNAIGRTLPVRIFETSTIQVELIAAMYAVLPSREKWMSCGRQSPAALEPSGFVMATQVKPEAVGHFVALTFDASMIR